MQDENNDSSFDDMINKRYGYGVKKDKYPRRVPKVRMAGPQDLSPEQLNIVKSGLRKGVLYLFFVDENSTPKDSTLLTSKEQDIISLLEDTVRSLKGLNPNDEYYWKLRNQLLKDMKEAVSAGLIWHPLVHEFVYTYRASGDKEILRRIKRGWEKGVKRPIEEKDVKFYVYLEKIEKYRSEGKTWPQIRRILMKRKVIGNITLEALRKKIAKFAPYLLRDKEFRITEEMLPLITDDIQNRMKELWQELYARGRKSQYRQEVKKLLTKNEVD